MTGVLLCGNPLLFPEVHLPCPTDIPESPYARHHGIHAPCVQHGSGKRRRQGRPSTLTDLSTLMEGLQAASHEAEAGAAEQLRRKGQSVTSQRGRARVL